MAGDPSSAATAGTFTETPRQQGEGLSMGQLWIISVKGAVPHSACFFDYDSGSENDGWLGFGPATHRRPVSSGKIFTDDETYRLNHGIIFDVVDTVMSQAADQASEDYSSGPYILGVRDCVSFSSDVARYCNLNVPLINMTPYGLIQILAVWNVFVKKW
jgi:hypothetical protein